jgi:iron complex transport system permease protein
MKSKRNTIAYISGICILSVMVIADLFCEGIPSHDIMIRLRAPRVITALLAGAALALSGAQMQSIFRNPLADPHIMGVSAGASLGAATATMIGGAAAGYGLSTALAAFTGAVCAAMIIIAVSKKFRHAATLLIFGIMLGFIVNAIVSILQFTSDAESLKLFYSWSAGSFSTSTWPQIFIMLCSLLLGSFIAFRNRKGLDIILFGDEFAEMAGADTVRIRLSALLSCCIMTGAVTAFCGPLGFAGIVAPHIARAALGTSSHRNILPASLMTGAMISIGADLISRLSHAPVPIASTMALVGIPIILYILIKKPVI